MIEFFGIKSKNTAFGFGNIRYTGLSGFKKIHQGRKLR
jgi:hypothetical protein